MPNLYHDYYDLEPREISSTYEGRHVTLPAELINSPAGGGVVVAKDPVTFGNVADGYGVGVAFNSGTGTDQIAIDTEGIWVLDVVAQDDEGASAVRIGDIIFINRTTCVLSKISSDTTNIVFGYALDTIASGTHGIAVKVHWDPWYDIYRDYAAAGAAEDALLIDVDDARVANAGYTQGLQITYNQTGVKTGTAEVHGAAIDLFVQEDVAAYAYGETIYVSPTSGKDINHMAALSIYMEDIGTGTVTRYYGIDIGMVATHNPTHSDAFCRFYVAGPGTKNAVLRIEGKATNMWWLNTTELPFVAAAVGGAQTGKIQIRIGAANWYIPLHTA